MTGPQVIWIAILFIIIGMTWGDPQPASSSTRQLPLQSVGVNDVDDDNDDNDMPLAAAGYIKIASIQSCVNTIEHLTAPRDAALVDLSHGSRAPPRAPAELIYRVVLLSLRTVFDRSEVCRDGWRDRGRAGMPAGRVQHRRRKPVTSARVADGVRACCRSTCATSRQRRRGASHVRPRRGLLRDEAQGRFARESPARARVLSTPARVDLG